MTNTTCRPATPYLRRGEVISWIEQLGIDGKQFEKLVHAGAIERIVLVPGGRGHYLRAAVELHLIKPFQGAEARMVR